MGLRESPTMSVVGWSLTVKGRTGRNTECIFMLDIIFRNSDSPAICARMGLQGEIYLSAVGLN